MAENLARGEFWLPSEFFAEEDILMDAKLYFSDNFNTNINTSHSKFQFCYGSSALDSSDSSLSSPVESVVGSTETESDEEDCMASLTLRMAQSMLFNDDKPPSPPFYCDTPKAAKVLARSPQSNPSELGLWSGCSKTSSRASSTGASQMSSPPASPLEKKDDAWDLLYAAAGQVVRMKMNDEALKAERQGLLGLPRKVAPPTGYYANEALNRLQMQHNQFQLLKQQQQRQQQLSSVSWGKQGKFVPPVHSQYQKRARPGGFINGKCGRPLGPSSQAWPSPAPEQPGSGMRAVFLGGPGLKRESSGTGVFLPRRPGSPSDYRKKTACSTVLVPARVVQALNLNIDELGSTQPLFQGRAFYEHDNKIPARGNNNTLLSHSTSAGGKYEIRLPQEWTY